MERSCKFCCSTISIIVILVSVGYIAIRIVDNIQDLSKKDENLYLLVIIMLCILYLIFAFLLIRALLKSAKYFSKLDVLENLMKSGKDNDNELIKKYCDTPVDL